jgi:hypothetical protein
LEEDWLLVNDSLPWLTLSIDLLRNSPENVYGILLRSEPMDGEIERLSVLSCARSFGAVWKFKSRPWHYVNGPTVYRMSSIRRIFAVEGYSDEWAFASQAKRMQYTPAFCTESEPRPIDVPARFAHIGKDSAHFGQACSGISYD